tara:strand:- start:41688 stop:41864 length:177 start_codon:yes stop_codon:yes gene_type:complete
MKIFKYLRCLFGHRWKKTFTYNMTADYMCMRCGRRGHGWANDIRPSKLTFSEFKNQIK